MLFNSLNFAYFFPIVFFAYWLLKNDYKKQNILLLLASYFFYACWDWRFMFLLATSTLLCFVGGNMIHNSTTESKRKFWVIFSVTVNLLFLGFFKYFNFFIESFQDLLSLFGFTPHALTLKIILPVGISFYTFHGLSYVLDIYYKRWQPTKSWVNYSLFVAYFPLLVAGPIERATHLLPQLEKKRTFDYSKMVDGMRQILWGLFKKIIIADGCAEYANFIFNNSEFQTGTTSLLAAVLFAFQIYGDFSGYSDIALGTSRMLGIELLQNFKFPYFSRDIAEFWRRWHVSLSSWFKDYLYIPLGGSRGGMSKTIRNTFIIFLVSGFWHGANWTFIVWGGLHALYIVPSIILKRNRKNLDIVAKGKTWPTINELFHMLVTFFLVVLAWIVFRTETITDAFYFVTSIARDPLSVPYLDSRTVILLLMAAFMFIMEWKGREGKYALERFATIKSTPLKWSFYCFVIFSIVFLSGGEQPFIYFQF